MLIIQERAFSEEAPCPYLPDRMMRNEYFFATDINGEELNGLLAEGWRKFGIYYFRPACRACRACTPLRVLTKEFRPSRSQRRVMDKNRDVRVRFGDLRHSGEIFEMYREHSLGRFGMEVSAEDFLFNFYQRSCPSLQSEYYLEGRLMAVGYLDWTHEAMSTVYFFYRMEFASRSPGVFSIIRELEMAGTAGLLYYYLGYYVPGSSRMEYKARFSPCEVYDWDKKKWGPKE